jgi:hypothetical protein
VNKKIYIKPEVRKLVLDYTISLQMLSGPIDPPGHGGTKKDDSEPFQSPFGDKPFS